MKGLINFLIMPVLFISGVACADDFKFKPPATVGSYGTGISEVDSQYQPVGDDVTTDKIYNSGDVYKGRQIFLYRIKNGSDYDVRGLPIAKKNFMDAVDSKIAIWDHIANCEMGSYEYVSPATLDACTFTVSAMCTTEIKCYTGDQWQCDFESSIPYKLVELLKQDKAENLGAEAINPYEDSLYKSDNCRLKTEL